MELVQDLLNSDESRGGRERGERGGERGKREGDEEGRGG